MTLTPHIALSLESVLAPSSIVELDTQTLKPNFIFSNQMCSVYLTTYL